ncbi:MAG: amidohydrolase family protein [Nitrospiraceae bacterium]|nr:amidohydrolase family protein [Nitrospiraceae bacterium]
MAPRFVSAATVETSPGSASFVLKNGLIVDGTGKPGVIGDVLVEGSIIKNVSSTPIQADCPVIDCTDKVIAPGFIDAHSHMDWVLPIEGHAESTASFIAQGCTTFVAGNCGFGAAGFRKDTPHREALTPGMFPGAGLTWNTMDEYFTHLRNQRVSHNLVALAGHGTTRASIRGQDPSPMSGAEMDEMLALLEEALEQGAAGVSFGLQYAPGVFAAMEEIERIATLVAKHDKILTVHGRAYSSLSGEYPPNPLGAPHNVLAIQEMIGVARKTGVRLQYSHLMFAGTTTHTTYTQCLDAIDKARADGIDVCTDSYPYHCGNSILEVVIPRWFREDLPANYHNPEALKRLEMELTMFSALVGLGFDDIQVTHAGHPDFNQYNGMSLTQIADKRGCTPFEAAMTLAENCEGGGPWILLRKYSNMQIIDALMEHPACLFMTDAVPGERTMNPAAYGSFSLFLQYARDRKRISLEQAVYKMTGATADRFRIKDRGYVRPGMAADLTVFDYAAIKDNNTLSEPTQAPDGITAVFMNGQRVLENGNVDTKAAPGQVLAV